MRNGSEMRLDTSALQHTDRCKVSRRLLDRDLLASFDQVCSHVIDHVYVGSGTVARSREILTENRITHILNSAGLACPEYFPDEFVYKTLWLKDSPSEDITSVLYIVFDFIEAVREQGGRVFVHCCKGVSRSTSLVIAYLIWLQKRTFQDAFNFVKGARAVTNPNLGFACQLLQFQKQLQNAPALSNKLRVYRMAPHSAHDPLLLVPKKVTGPDTLSFDSRGVFVIHGQYNLYVWHGQVSDVRMAKAGHEFALQLIRYEHVEGSPVNVNENDEPAEFWELLRTGIFSRTSSDVSTSGSDAPIQPQKSVEESSSVNCYVVDGDVLLRRLQGLCPGGNDTSRATDERGCEEPDCRFSPAGGSGAGQHDWNDSGRVCRPLRTLSIYDKDFELFESAKELSEKNESSPASKDSNGWRRLRGKFFSGADNVGAAPSANEGLAARQYLE